MDEKEQFTGDLKSRNFPLNEWPIQKLKKEAEGDSDRGQAVERDEIGIE